MPQSTTLEQMRVHFQAVKEIIQAEDMWERVPDHAREFSAENLEKLVKYAYFGGFLDLGGVNRLLFLKKGETRPLLIRWYEEIRQKGCWLC